MEAYYEFQIDCDETLKDAIIAELAEENFEGFLENEKGFSAFVPQSRFDQAVFESILTHYQINPLSVPQNTIQQQNWNAQWEASYEPITIGKDIIVKAPFHVVDENFRYELIIQPKNTFGTGHHETTQLMLQLMLEIDFAGRAVFDYGCGTGVLGIFSSILGADTVMAIDIDSWSEENINENCSLNGVRNVRFRKGDLSVAADVRADIILANINKNILLESFAQLARVCNDKGHLLISGFYENDLPEIKKAAEESRFRYEKHIVKNEWCAAQFQFDSH